jgi:hypothetical protein
VKSAIGFTAATRSDAMLEIPTVGEFASGNAESAWCGD